MNPLHLSGWGVKIRTRSLRSRSELEVTDGREDARTGPTVSYRPRRFPYSSIIIDGHSGYVSLQAFHWLSRNRIPVFVLNFDGSLISSILPPMPVKADLRAAQFRACADPAKKFAIAQCIVQAKVARSLQVLDWLAQRYDIAREVRFAKREATNLAECGDVANLRSVEGRVATKYWLAFRHVMPESLLFEGRMTSSHQNNASDPVNSALNYGYGFLEGEVRRAINSVGLEPSVGFLHDFSDYQTKQSLVYDLQEPFRWIVDVSVVEAFETGTLDLRDFYFTGDDYRYRFEINAKQRFIDVLRKRFNAGVSYRGRILKWDTAIEQKTNELSRFLNGKTSNFDLEDPAPRLDRQEDRGLRAQILELTPSRAKQLGIGKSTLHYLRARARNEIDFRIYRETREKLVPPVETQVSK